MSYASLRAWAWRMRYFLAAFVVLAIVAAILEGIARLEPPVRPVAALTRSLPAGHTLESTDITMWQVAEELIPDDVIEQPEEALGRQLVASLPKGMPLTHGVLLTSEFLEKTPSGHAIVPITVDDAVGTLLSPGAAVSLFSLAIDEDNAIETITDSAVIVGASQDESPSSVFSGSTGERIFYVSVPTAQAGAVIAANARGLYAALMPP
ncbi:MAG: SAF domain-containing protein [Ancrocorticia sp.]|nr:SAF domain-containing protein [Ancrocorticia sp.]